MNLYNNKQWLEETYDQYKSIYKVAELASCSAKTIHEWMKKYDIPRIGNIDRHQSKNTKKKISESSLGRKPMLGRKHSEETKNVMSKRKKGKNNPNWKGGVTSKVRKFRKTKDYVAWKKTILERTGGKCEECGSQDSVEAHHKISLYIDFSKGLDLNNGQALCKEYHKKKDWRRNQDE